MQLAQVSLWSGDHAAALERLTRLATEKKLDKPELWRSFVDAAAGTPKGKMTKQQLTLLEQLASRPVPAETAEPARYWSRLAWSLLREDRKEIGQRILERALAAQAD